MLGQLPGEGLYLPPPPPRQKKSPRSHPAPTPRAATHLPKPAVPNLLKVQEAVPAEVCGLEQLHCNRAGGSGTSAQPRSPPHLPSLGPLRGCPLDLFWGATLSPPELGPQLGAAIRIRGAMDPQVSSGHLSGWTWEGCAHATGTSQAGTAGPGAGPVLREYSAAGAEATGVACPLTPATGWHSSARHPKGSFVGDCLALPRTGHTGLILLQAHWVRSAGGRARAAEAAHALPRQKDSPNSAPTPTARRAQGSADLDTEQNLEWGVPLGPEYSPRGYSLLAPLSGLGSPRAGSVS